jgi:hypothetical protein
MSQVRHRCSGRINKMNRTYESRNRSLTADHPVNPVHPVQSLNFRSGAKERNSDRTNKMKNRKADLLAPTILLILFILSNLLASPEQSEEI